MTGNKQLAGQARALADKAGRGTVERKAALCAAVLLDASRTVAAARKLLGEIEQHDIREQASALLAGEIGKG